MICTIKAQYKLHSEYKGVPIYQRQAGTGTSGGMWLAVNCTCKSLASARRCIDEAEACRSLPYYQTKWESQKAKQ